MSAAENPKYIQALRQKFQSGESLSPDPHWNGHFDSFTCTVLHLLVHDQITLDQARQVLGDDLNLAVWTRFSDLAEAFSVAHGEQARETWKEFAAFSEKVQSPDPREHPHLHP